MVTCPLRETNRENVLNELRISDLKKVKGVISYEIRLRKRNSRTN